MKTRILTALVVLISVANFAFGQTTEFTYQGRLVDGGLPANASYDFTFRLFDIDTGGTSLAGQIVSGVAVSNGIFTVGLDLGDNFDGGARWLEIAVRPSGPGAYTTLSPRQPLSSTPYSIRSLNAGTAANSLRLGGVEASQFVVTTDGRMSDARVPLPNSGNYVQNTASQQAASNFNISGNGTAGGTLSANTVNAATQYNIGGSRVFITSTFSSNIFAGNGAGASNGIGSGNSFFGQGAGQSNVSTGNNSFFGRNAGQSNIAVSNSFFGESSGFGTSTGGSNSFFGQASGRNNSTGSENAFFGYRAGFNNTVSGNSFFGFQAGDSVTTGEQNSFFGRNAGAAVSTAVGNSFFGHHAGRNNIAINNTFVGASAGGANVTGGNNAFFGKSAGLNNTASGNSFFGGNAGFSNTSGNGNAFFGGSAGFDNTTGSGNTYFGSDAGFANTNGHSNSFFGSNAGRFTNAAGSVFDGARNSFFGYYAGEQNTTGNNNVFIGNTAGRENTSGQSNTLIGSRADVSSGGLQYATAIGAESQVATSNTIQLGRTNGSDTVFAPGLIRVNSLGAAGATDVCRNASSQLSTCSSSLRYKTEIQLFEGGLDIVRRLKPISFRWNNGGIADLGFGAEDVNSVEPLLATRNDRGEIEGVKYKQITTVLVNAVNEQQAQIDAQAKRIDEQKTQIDALKKLVCLSNPQADLCLEEPN